MVETFWGPLRSREHNFIAQMLSCKQILEEKLRVGTAKRVGCGWDSSQAGLAVDRRRRQQEGLAADGRRVQGRGSWKTKWLQLLSVSRGCYLVPALFTGVVCRIAMGRS